MEEHSRLPSGGGHRGDFCDRMSPPSLAPSFNRQGLLFLQRASFDKAWHSGHLPEVNISLTPELEKAVKEKVASGLYNNASEVIREALRQSLRSDAENQWLQREAAIGYAQLEAGETLRVHSKDEFMALARRPE
jgi:antitoxin ParD1/3/4